MYSFLTGNLCTQKPGYRAFVIATLPQLQSLDGTPITKSERISAEQEYAAIKRALDEEFGEQLLVGNDAETVMETVTEINKTDAQEQAERDDKGDEELIPHTPEARLAAARELAAKRKFVRACSELLQPSCYVYHNSLTQAPSTIRACRLLARSKLKRHR